MTYLKDPGHGAERSIRRLAFKYTLIDDELYRRTTDDELNLSIQELLLFYKHVTCD